MALFTNNIKIGAFYNLRLFGTELRLRMTVQVKYLAVILDKKLDWLHELASADIASVIFMT
jgi:hypothetical protein